MPRLPKYSPQFDLYLRDILQQDRTGCVVLLAGSDARARDALAARVKQNVGRECVRRVWLQPALPVAAYYRLFRLATLVLDAPAYAGNCTAYGAFSLGVPVLTQVGPLAVQCYAAALYRRMEMEEFLVARDRQQYVAPAVRMGTETGDREHLVRTLEERDHAIFDDSRVTREYERFFRPCSRSPRRPSRAGQFMEVRHDQCVYSRQDAVHAHPVQELCPDPRDISLGPSHRVVPRGAFDWLDYGGHRCSMDRSAGRLVLPALRIGSERYPIHQRAMAGVLFAARAWGAPGVPAADDALPAAPRVSRSGRTLRSKRLRHGVLRPRGVHPGGGQVEIKDDAILEAYLDYDLNRDLDVQRSVADETCYPLQAPDPAVPRSVNMVIAVVPAGQFYRDRSIVNGTMNT